MSSVPPGSLLLCTHNLAIVQWMAVTIDWWTMTIVKVDVEWDSVWFLKLKYWNIEIIWLSHCHMGSFHCLQPHFGDDQKSPHGNSSGQSRRFCGDSSFFLKGDSHGWIDRESLSTLTDPFGETIQASILKRRFGFSRANYPWWTIQDPEWPMMNRRIASGGNLTIQVIHNFHTILTMIQCWIAFRIVPESPTLTATNGWCHQ